MEIHSSYLSPQHLETSTCAEYCTCMSLEWRNCDNDGDLRFSLLRWDSVKVLEGGQRVKLTL